MFSFFRKKSPTADTPVEARDAGAPLDPAVVEPAPSPSARPRTAMEWLNADVGELFFGKKPAEAPPEAPTSTPPVTPLKAPPETPSVKPVVPTIAPSPAPAEPEDRSDWLAKLRTGLRRTGSNIAQVLVGASIDDAIRRLEAALLQADAGVAATRHLLDDLQRRIKRAHLEDPAAVRGLLADCVADLLAPLERPLVIGEHVPTVIMVVGVNGAGKTTSVGKLARHLVDADQKVLLAAADTFRAAAREQLLAWAERAEPARDGSPAAARIPVGNRIEIVSQEGGDPAGVTFDAVVAGRARGCDVVIADTAGRLATQAHLMEELKKIRRTIAKAEPGAPHEVLLVIDGNTGQNALAQVQAFDAALQLTGLIVTKLDGTAKGGVLAAIALWSRERERPCRCTSFGVGEKLAVCRPFARANSRRPCSARACQRCSCGGSTGETDSSSSSNQVEPVGSPTSITSPWVQSRSVSANGSVVGAVTVSGASAITAPAITTAAPVVSGCRSTSGFLAMAAGTAGVRGRSLSRAASIVGSRSSFQTWTGMLAAASTRSTRSRRARSRSPICSTGGRTSTTAITCEVTSQITKSTHWLPRRRIHSA